MRAKIIVLAVLATVSCANRAGAMDEMFKQGFHEQQWERMHRDDGGSEGCGAGCALMLGVAALAVYEYAQRQRALREQRESPRDDAPAGDGQAGRGSGAEEADDEIWRVKAVPDQYTRSEYLTVFAEPSVASQQLARLSPGFSGLRMAGECQAAEETRGMCPILIPVRDRFYRGWIVGDIIEPVSRNGSVY